MGTGAGRGTGSGVCFSVAGPAPHLGEAALGRRLCYDSPPLPNLTFGSTTVQSPNPSLSLTPLERRAALSLAGIYALRMMGLFLILPVFAIYARELPNVTPMHIGLAIGIYGLTQALLQIPFGLLSDRIGRKPVIIGGLLIFALGSAVAATADSIQGIILGRALQGSGAVAAAVMAMAADLSREEVRTRVMAIIGMSIGGSFILSLVLGPVLGHWIGVPGIFWLVTLLALGGVLVVIFLVPKPVHSGVHRDTEAVPAQFRAVLGNRELLRLDLGVFSMHLLMTALFLAVPLELRQLGLETERHWLLYLPVMLVSVAVMVPFIILAEKRQRMKPVLLGAIGVLVLAELALYLAGTSLPGMALALVLYFAAFNLLEASLPSLVSKLAPAAAKGTAMGFFSTSQFLGAFVGGLLGGWLQQQAGPSGLFLGGALVALVWLLVALPMAKPRHLTTELARLAPLSEVQARLLAQRLSQVPGVAEAVVVPDEAVAYLKLDQERLNRADLDEVLADAA